MSSPQTQSLKDRYLQFALGKENYAVPLLNVREVIALPKTTPVPQSPAYLVGIMNLRGVVISIVDLKKRLGIKESPAEGEKEEAVVIIESQSGALLGVCVDAVKKVFDANPESIANPSTVESKVPQDQIMGIHKSTEQLTLILNMMRIFDMEGLAKIA